MRGENVLGALVGLVLGALVGLVLGALVGLARRARWLAAKPRASAWLCGRGVEREPHGANGERREP